MENIFFAEPTGFVKATETIMHSAGVASAVWLPVVTKERATLI